MSQDQGEIATKDSPGETSLRHFYEAFNARDIDTLLGALHPDVDWPNGWEGGRMNGREAVRAYWNRQWAEIDPSVAPTAFRAEPEGRVAVRVDQLVKDKGGAILSQGQVEHVYTFENGLVRSMDIHALDQD